LENIQMYLKNSHDGSTFSGLRTRSLHLQDTALFVPKADKGGEGGVVRGAERVAAPFIMLTTLSHLLRDILLTALKMEPVPRRTWAIVGSAYNPIAGISQNVGY